MFNSELFEISEKVYRQTDVDYIKKRNKRIESEVLKLIKENIPNMEEDGTIIINYKSNEKEHAVFKQIIDLSLQKYFEDEYCLYHVGDYYIPQKNGVGNYCVITFRWNSIEYNEKNCFDKRAQEIIKTLDNKKHKNKY